MILLTGSTGYVGSEFQKQLVDRNYTYLCIPRHIYIDPIQLMETIRITKAAFLINCAGYTGKPNVDACEINKDKCIVGNSILINNISIACKLTNTPFGHISSGCVYNGYAKAYTEKDIPNFSFRDDQYSFYSGTKVLSEELIQSHTNNCYIWRLRMPFNHVKHERNYLTKLLTYDKLYQAVNSLSNLNDFVYACIESFVHHIEYGIYNITNTGFIDTLTIVKLLQKHLPTTKEFNFFKSESEFLELVKTPRSNCILDNSKLTGAGIFIPHIEEAIVKSIKQYN